MQLLNIIGLQGKMSKDQWISLTRNEQLTWDTFSNKSKAIILRLMAPQPIVKQSVTFDYQNNKAHNINTMVSSTNNYYIDNQDSTQHLITDAHEGGINNDNLVSYLTNQYDHPGDIRNVLSSPKSSNNKANFKGDKDNREAITTEILYSISKISTRERPQ